MEPIDSAQSDAVYLPPESDMTARPPLGAQLRLGGRPQRSVIGEILITSSLNTALRIGRELPGGGWQQSEHVVLTPVEREALIDILTAHRSRCLAQLEERGHVLPEGPLNPAEWVILNYLADWHQPEPEHRAAGHYAAGIVFGQFDPITEWSQLDSIAATLGSLPDTIVPCSEQDEEPNTSQRATLGNRQWRLGISLIHALADGVVTNGETGESFGETTALVDAPIELPSDVLRGTHLTLAGFAAAFGGDLFATAGAFVRASQALDYSSPLED